MKDVVHLTNRAIKDLTKIPTYIADKLLTWVDLVESQGVSRARMIPGYHDEPLRGNRVGQRSIRLNRSYRAIYVTSRGGLTQVITILEVNKHEYKSTKTE